MFNLIGAAAMMTEVKRVAMCVAVAVAGCGSETPQLDPEPRLAVGQEAIAEPGASIRRLRNTVYGYGAINVSGDSQERPLLLDAYLPPPPEGRNEATPAIIMAFGGAYHRGEKGDFQFYEDGAHDSSMADYCEAFAARGIACFSIDYRLTPEDPAMPEGIDTSQLLPENLLLNPLVTGRVEVVRARMGLPPLDDTSRRQLWNATFAAVDDLETALGFVRDNAQSYNIDPEQVALGGFSAGAMTAMNLAYGKGADIVAVISLSGTIWGYDLEKTVASDGPPLLMFAAQSDLAGIRQGSGQIANVLTARGVSVTQAWVPGFGHFYPMEAPSLSSGFETSSVLERSLDFLGRSFGTENEE